MISPAELAHLHKIARALVREHAANALIVLDPPDCLGYTPRLPYVVLDSEASEMERASPGAVLVEYQSKIPFGKEESDNGDPRTDG